MNRDEIIENLERFGKLFEIRELIGVFKGYREDDPGQEVTVEIWDRGEPHKQRFTILARDQDGKEATGNDENTIVNAISTTHWQDLSN